MDLIVKIDLFDNELYLSIRRVTGTIECLIDRAIRTDMKGAEADKKKREEKSFGFFIALVKHGMNIDKGEGCQSVGFHPLALTAKHLNR
jgi:hypothetical protein